MSDASINEYTVCILFDDSLSNILLVRKTGTAFAGMLNGIGGLIDKKTGEAPYECALRRILCETGLGYYELEELAPKTRLAKIGSLSVPNDCKTRDGSGCVLHYYAGAIRKPSVENIKPGDEPLEWAALDDVLSSGVSSGCYAGNGNLPYFAKAAYDSLRKLINIRRPAMKLPETKNSALEEIARARGRMDAAFHKNDLRAASDEASEIAKLAYAAFYFDTHERK